MRRVADERGQTLVLAVAFVVLLLGVVALVVDVGSWFRAQRRLQTVVDAAALAGVQELPALAAAKNMALVYAEKNGGPNSEGCDGVNLVCVTFPDDRTIVVIGRATAPGFFAKLYNDAAKSRDFSEVVVRAHARAKVGAPTSLDQIAPVAVKDSSACTDASCFGVSRQLTFAESALSASSFGLIDLTCSMPPSSSCSGTASASEIYSWIRCSPCFNGRIGVDVSYPAAAGQKLGRVKQALEESIGNRLLVPVFDSASDASKSYHIVGFAAFVVEGVSWSPHSKLLQGHFVTYITHDAELGPGPMFGVRVVALTG